MGGTALIRAKKTSRVQRVIAASPTEAATECWVPTAETTTHEVVPASELGDSPIWGPPHEFQLP